MSEKGKCFLKKAHTHIMLPYIGDVFYFTDNISKK